MNIFYKAISRKIIFKALIAVFIAINLATVSLFLFHEVFNFTSSNSAVYFLKSNTGLIEIKRDLFFEDADRLLFMFDANQMLNYLMRGLAIAKGKPVLELSWNSGSGVGDIKQFRSDGTMISLSFSRFKADSGEQHGLFLGGDLPYGDGSRSRNRNNSGFGYYDGTSWSHIWCASNEGLHIARTNQSVLPPMWKYSGSRVIKNTQEEIILESEHEVDIDGTRIKMTRDVALRAEEDYFLMRIRITNPNYNPFTYSYAYGDEPWVGNYGTSDGDVGWYDRGVIQYEKFISPLQHKYAGYWDYGNEAAGEKHLYTGSANFIEWISPTPSYVFFSNTLDDCCKELSPLSSKNNRVLNIVWFNQTLMPGESRDHIFAVGMAKVDPATGFPKKPAINLH